MALSSRGGKKKAQRDYSDSEDDFEFGDEKIQNGDYDDDFEDGDSDNDDEDRPLGYDDEDDDENDDEDDDEDDGEDHNRGGNDDEMIELEKEYMDLRNKEEDILKNLKQHKDDDLQKGEAVKNQKALWDKSLELRVLLQKAFSSSNRLPQDAVRSSFCKADEVNKAYVDMVKSTKETLDSLFKLQEALVEQNPSIAQSGEGNSSKSSHKRSLANDSVNTEYDEEWQKISEMHKRIASFRDKSVDKWQRKTQVTSGVAAMKNKLHAFNQNISEQVSSYMRDPSRMLKQMQQRRSAISIFGVASENVESNRGEEGDVGGDPELVDDSEFYQQLLKEFFETVDITSSESAFYAVKRLQTKKRKIVDRRASKSRKIRYHVHEKIVNFMTPQPMVLPDMAPKLFQNLFGSRT